MPALFEFQVGQTRPAITGVFPNQNLTGAVVTCDIQNLATGADAFVAQTATVTRVAANATYVKYEPAVAWAAGEYIGWFIATLAGQTYRSPGFMVVVTSDVHTPSTHPYQYGDGRGGYANASDVSLLLRGLGNRTGKGANNQNFAVETDDSLIETLLADTAEEIDRVIEKLYLLPITKALHPKAAGYLRQINKFWALAAFYDVHSPSDPERMLMAATNWREKGAQMIDDVIEGNITLDASAAPGQPVQFEYQGAMISSDMVDDATDVTGPIFSMDHFSQRGRLYR